MPDLAWLVAIWALLAIGVALIARARGRDPFAWLAVAMLLSPLIAVVAMLIAPKADPGRAGVTLCGRCGKRISPYWKEGCAICGAPFSEFPPVQP